jgi:hypothetical protein
MGLSNNKTLPSKKGVKAAGIGFCFKPIVATH